MRMNAERTLQLTHTNKKGQFYVQYERRKYRKAEYEVHVKNDIEIKNRLENRGGSSSP